LHTNEFQRSHITLKFEVAFSNLKWVEVNLPYVEFNLNLLSRIQNKFRFLEFKMGVLKPLYVEIKSHLLTSSHTNLGANVPAKSFLFNLLTFDHDHYLTIPRRRYDDDGLSIATPTNSYQ